LAEFNGISGEEGVDRGVPIVGVIRRASDKFWVAPRRLGGAERDGENLDGSR